MYRGSYLHLGLLVGTLALAGWGSRPARAAVPGWTDQDFNTTTAGSAKVDTSTGVWTIQGAGSDTWERNDQFHIVYQPLKGDGRITTRLLTAEEGNEYSKCGLMTRNDLTNKAAQVIQIHMTTGHQGEALYRGLSDPDPDNSSLGSTRMAKDWKMGDSQLFPRKFPTGLTIQRRGNRFTAYARQDETGPWIPVSRDEKLPMGDQIVAGVYVCSHDESSLLTATFDGKATEVSNTLLKPEEVIPLQPNPIIATGLDNAVMLTWSPVDHMGHPADGYVIYRQKTGEDKFTMIGSVTGDKSSFLDDKIKNGEAARYRVTTVVNVGGKTLESRMFDPNDPDNSNKLNDEGGAPNPPVTINNTVFSASLLGGGGNKEYTDTAGSASIDANGVVTLKASGWDIQESFDGGEQLMTPVHGDFTFTARVLGVPSVEGGDVNEWAKFGIKVAENTQAESRYAAMLLTPQHGIRSPHRRMWENGWSDDVGPNEDTPASSVSLRIQRTGNTLKFFRSDDGKTFSPYGVPDTLEVPDLNQDLFVGLVGTAHDNSQVAQAKFDQIQLTTP
jgi:regulation of enolase protein 1 (concanavalin A-like superfamily)